MKIVIDGFNLGQLHGTGIATYSRELAASLTASGHDIYPLYGLDKVSNNTKINNSQFIQKLGTKGESGRQDIFRWFFTFLFNSWRHILNLSFKVVRIKTISQIELGNTKEKIPSHRELFNSPSIFRSAQAYSFFSGKVTKISMPESMDLFHLTSPLPISMVNTPKVVTIHDLIPIILPSSTEVNLRHYHKMVAASICDASAVFCVSETSRNDLLKYFDFPENKIHVTYQSAELPSKVREISKESVEIFLKNQFKLRYGEYFVFYGSIEPKKNVARIIEAFTRAKTDFPVVIVGKNGWLHEDVDQLLSSLHRSKLGKRRYVRLPYLSFQNLMHLLKGARGLVFPSLYEGFGLPVLEAMQMGCPVITSNISSLPEVGGNAVHYVDPYDVTSIASAVDKFSSEDLYCSELIKKGHLQALKFSRSKYIELLNTGYLSAMN